MDESHNGEEEGKKRSHGGVTRDDLEVGIKSLKNGEIGRGIISTFEKIVKSGKGKKNLSDAQKIMAEVLIFFSLSFSFSSFLT